MMDKIIYLAFARMPTEKAHGFTIAKACESFAREGKNVELWIPKRRTSVKRDIFSAYGLEQNFLLRQFLVPDLIRIFRGIRGAFTLHLFLFLIAVKLRLLFGRRRGVLIYTREALALLFVWLGYRTVLECHAISQHRNWYFFLARRASCIIVISHALKDAFLGAGFPDGKIIVAPSGVDLSVFDLSISQEKARKKLNLPHKATLAIYTGNFTTMGEDKGISDILRALEKTPDINFAAVGGSARDISRYKREAEELGVQDRVTLHPHASQAMLALFECAADMLLMPFPDTPHYRKYMSPVKMFEYMAAKRPIVASDLPTIREVLDDSSARFVPPGDAYALSAALRDLRDHPLESARLAESAYAKVSAYTWDARASRILTFIASA